MQFTYFWSKSPYYKYNTTFSYYERTEMQSNCGFHEGTWCANVSWRREKSLGKILLLHDFRLYEDRESVKKMVTLCEVMIACPQKLNLQADLNLRKKMQRGVKRTQVTSGPCTYGRMHSIMFRTQGRSDKLKSQLIECQKLWKP